MKNCFLMFSALIIFISGFGQDKTAKLDELMNAYAKAFKFNGAVMVVKDGRILLDKGYGFRNVKDSVRNDENSIFQIGSITKQFTATVILKLQEEKKLSVQDKLSKYFPDYPKGDSITIQQLLTHTSGIYSYTNDQAFMSTEVSKPSDRKRMMALFKDKPLQFSPGTQWEYSNSGYSLLGYIIEDVAKMPYEQAVRKYIFEPLGMSHSGFDFTHLNSKEKATGYFRLNDEGNLPAPIVDSSVSFSAGAIYTTVGDLNKWAQALQTNAIISKASMDKATTPVKNNYGYGLAIDSIAGKRAVGHSGGIHGFNSNMVRIPEDNTSVILLNNTASPNLDKITKSIFAILYDLPYELPKERTTITMPEAVLQQYTGVYELTPQLVITITLKDGVLTGKPEGQEALKLHPEKEDQFFLKEVDAEIKFIRNEKKEVTGMTLLQNGSAVTGKKRL